MSTHRTDTLPDTEPDTTLPATDGATDGAAAGAAARPAGRSLRRETDGRPAAPVRIVHLGVGNFFRAHAAWYTEHASDAAQWGIAAFTGRSPAIAESLAGQDGLYTLLVRGPGGARPEVISSLTAVHPADDLEALRGYFVDPAVAVVTITVTEAGYRRNSAGGLDVDASDVSADIAALQRDPRGVVSTTPGKLVAGLLARRATGGGPIAVVPNDNVPDNGAMVARVVGDLAALVDVTLPAWIDAHVSWVTTMVDRITPRSTADDRAEVLSQTGIDDPETVPTEPFSEWVLAGTFPAGRPDWESAGATVVDDVRPFETRKLWLLNGSHSLMAYAGSILGHETVADAIADPLVRSWVEEWWDAAAPHVDLPAVDVSGYRQALLDRYRNPQIRHLLAQIAADGSQKVPIRALPVIRAELAQGRVAPGATRIVAAWVPHLRGLGAPVTDTAADEVRALAQGEPEAAVRSVLVWLGLDDSALEKVLPVVLAQLAQLTGLGGSSAAATPPAVGSRG
ncbi:fructuronate reductase [Humibacillus xanthopallidus]|uniref:Fructuronate reductase n=1 Tax=Humibacillus xanthopallidus TaxID=412689 RepID=A0A543PTH1_9MICO|nr:mannitol dehydrogenase family protein [Humibacillus xanthopallidus]TQN47378.1 fructuronate reductase [Humibacillus xanthopallidus]